MKKAKSKEFWVLESNKKYKGKFNYSKVDYKRYTHDKVIIICPTHGEFKVTPHSHLNSKFGCPLCSKDFNKKRLISNNKNPEFIKQNKEKIKAWCKDNPDVCKERTAKALITKGPSGTKAATKKSTRTQKKSGIRKKIANCPIRKSKERRTKELNGIITPLNKLSPWERYVKKVWSITNKNDLSQLQHFEKRGRGKGKYSLDHKISTFYGFHNNISPEIIGHIKNLEFIPCEDNSRKHVACSLQIEELMEYINND